MHKNNDRTIDTDDMRMNRFSTTIDVEKLKVPETASGGWDTANFSQ